MTINKKSVARSKIKSTEQIPSLNVSRIGLVVRDYRDKFSNGFRDFTYVLPQVLELLDEEGCDAVLFSLFSIVPRESFNPYATFDGLRNIKAIFLEEFQDGKIRNYERYVTYYRTSSCWKEYDFCQVFGTITDLTQQGIDDFVLNEIPKRILGNCCILLCGETNGVKYSKIDKKVHDKYRLKMSIPKGAKVILNPIHDRMTRFEMKLKRQFLSEGNRWVISIWNKGKQDKNGKVKDGKGPAWTIFYNGDEVEVERIQNQIGVEIGILDAK